MNVTKYFQTFLAINLHFRRSGSYDYFKYNGKVRADPEKLKLRKDRFAFNAFHKKDTHEQFISRVVAYNFYEKKSPWSAIELKRPVAIKAYEQWNSDIKNLKKIVENDIKAIDNIKNYVKIEKSKFLPNILTDVIGGKIHPFTFICIDSVLGLSERLYDKHYHDNLIYHDSMFLLKKARPFVVINKEIKDLIVGKIKSV